MSDNIQIYDKNRDTVYLRSTEVSTGVHVPHHYVELNAEADELNSSSIGLSADNSYTFTGEAASTLGVNAIQISLMADQDCLVRVQQSPDGTNWDLDDWFHYESGTNFGTTVQAISSYERVMVSSASAGTSDFRLQTVLCPIADPLPRALDANRNLKVAAATDELGFKARHTPQNDTLSSVRFRIAGAQFDGSAIDTNYWTTSVSTGSVSQGDGTVTLTSGTANGHYARIYSTRRARYISGVSNMARMNVRMGDTGTTDVKRRWGISYGASMPTITDGAFFELDGTAFSVVTMRKDGTETRVSSGSFNGYLGFNHVPTLTKSNTYEILWTNTSVWFMVNGELLHKATSTTKTWAVTMSQHLWFDVVNAGGSSAVSMYIRNASIFRLGELHSQPRYRNIAGATAGTLLKAGAGFLHRVVVNKAGTLLTLADSATTSTPPIGVVAIDKNDGVIGSIEYMCPFHDGLYVVITGSGADVTFIYE